MNCRLFIGRRILDSRCLCCRLFTFPFCCGFPYIAFSLRPLIFSLRPFLYYRSLIQLIPIHAALTLSLLISSLHDLLIAWTSVE